MGRCIFLMGRCIFLMGTGGDTLSFCTISCTGETLALGTSGGYLHLWTDQEEPRVNQNSDHLEVQLRGYCRVVSVLLALISWLLQWSWLGQQTLRSECPEDRVLCRVTVLMVVHSESSFNCHDPAPTSISALIHMQPNECPYPHATLSCSHRHPLQYILDG
jgi:hypothetical protein